MTKIKNRVYLGMLIASLLVGMAGGVAIGQYTLYKGILLTDWGFTPVQTTIHAQAIEEEETKKTIFETLKIQTGIPDAYVTIHTEDQIDTTLSQSEVTLKTDTQGMLSYSFIPAVAEDGTRSVRVSFTINEVDFTVDMSDKGMDVVEGDIQIVGAKGAHHTDWYADILTTTIKCKGIPTTPAEATDQAIVTQSQVYISPPNRDSGITTTIDGETTSHTCVGDGCLVIYYCKPSGKTEITIEQDGETWVFADDSNLLSEVSGKMDIQQDVRVVTLLETPAEDEKPVTPVSPQPSTPNASDSEGTAPMQKEETPSPTPQPSSSSIAQGMPTGIQLFNPLTWVCHLFSNWG